jgi:phospho-N-acetylmuramoyl-pentapeptide-transferase
MALLWVAVPAFAVAWLLGLWLIPFLKQKMFGQFIREDGPQHHLAKAGTPTGGGVLILAGMAAGLLSACWLFPGYLTSDTWVVAAVALIFGLLGFADDRLKILKKHNKGVTGYTKLWVQVLTGAAVGVYALTVNQTSSTALFHFANVPLGWFYPVFTAWVITAASNAVNLTDGLDGLAASTTLISLAGLGALFAGSAMTASIYPDLALAVWSLFGATLAFLVFNRYPARIFMGDTGSLALGGAIGALVLLSKVEWWLVLLGGVFVLEVVSVLLQVASFKTTGKRIFKMSPLHHHFELCGWSEVRVVTTFALVQAVGCALTLWLYFR